MGAIFDSNDDITGYQCVECTSIIDPNTGVAWVSGSTIDCSITAIESEFCGTNMYPSKFTFRFDIRVVRNRASGKFQVGKSEMELATMKLDSCH